VFSGDGDGWGGGGNRRTDSRAGGGGSRASNRAGPSSASGSRDMPANKMPKWKRDRAALQNALGAGRAAAKAEADGTPYTAPQGDDFDDRVPCPHCGRKFNEIAAERHIPKCSSIVRPRTRIHHHLHHPLHHSHFRTRPSLLLHCTPLLPPADGQAEDARARRRGWERADTARTTISVSRGRLPGAWGAIFCRRRMRAGPGI
jgi:hypothetical protein